jgi:uncharacterized OB-fold protein
VTYSKPIPTLRGEERLFFEQAKQHVLVYQQCASCGERIFYPRTVCPACTSVDLRVARSAGRGIIHSFTTMYRAGNPTFADDVPYTVVLVDLDEGVRVIGDLVGSEPNSVEIGLPVEVFFDDVTDEFTLPRFCVRKEHSGGE